MRVGLAPGMDVVGVGGSHAPIRRLAGVVGAMTVVRGPGLLSQVIERGEAVSCDSCELTPECLQVTGAGRGHRVPRFLRCGCGSAAWRRW